MEELISKTKTQSLLKIRAEYACSDEIFDELTNIFIKIGNMPAVEAIPITWLKRNALACYDSSDNPFQSVLKAWELENHETKE